MSADTHARRRLLGISGSLRAQSFSTAVLRALADASAWQAEYDYAEIGSLPHFNQDLYVEPLPSTVARFRRQIAEADGLVISSPEYNHGIPGVLKNALDWASRPHNGSPLRNKPVLIMTSSPALVGRVSLRPEIRNGCVESAYSFARSVVESGGAFPAAQKEVPTGSRNIVEQALPPVTPDTAPNRQVSITIERTDGVPHVLHAGDSIFIAAGEARAVLTDSGGPAAMIVITPPPSSWPKPRPRSRRPERTSNEAIMLRNKDRATQSKAIATWEWPHQAWPGGHHHAMHRSQ